MLGAEGEQCQGYYQGMAQPVLGWRWDPKYWSLAYITTLLWMLLSPRLAKLGEILTPSDIVLEASLK